MTALSAPLDERAQDALRETISIGCGQGLSALGRLLSRRIDMEVPEPRPLPDALAVATLLGGLGPSIVAVAVTLEGRLRGELILALSEPDAGKIAAAMGHPTHAGWNELARSSLEESGNVVGSFFVSAVAKMSGGKLLLSVPRFCRGSGASCASALLGQGSGALAMVTRFTGRGGDDAAKDRFKGILMVMPDPGHLGPLLTALQIR
jgi:chemotaxis protein CheC